jgi:hypothetical protein
MGKFIADVVPFVISVPLLGMLLILDAVGLGESRLSLWLACLLNLLVGDDD